MSHNPFSRRNPKIIIPIPPTTQYGLLTRALLPVWSGKSRSHEMWRHKHTSTIFFLFHVILYNGEARAVNHDNTLVQSTRKLLYLKDKTFKIFVGLCRIYKDTGLYPMFITNCWSRLRLCLFIQICLILFFYRSHALLETSVYHLVMKILSKSVFPFKRLPEQTDRQTNKNFKHWFLFISRYL